MAQDLHACPHGRMGTLCACVCACLPTRAHFVHGVCMRGCMAHQPNLVAGLHAVRCVRVQVLAAFARLHTHTLALAHPSHTMHAMPTLNTYNHHARRWCRAASCRVPRWTWLPPAPSPTRSSPSPGQLGWVVWWCGGLAGSLECAGGAPNSCDWLRICGAVSTTISCALRPPHHHNPQLLSTARILK